MNENVFTKIGKQWMLIGATKGEKSNAMTASWGGLGIMWGKEVAYIFIRDSRYTKELVDGSDKISVSFMPEDKKNVLAYMGKASGRYEDKITKSNLHMIEGYDIPVFEESELTLICKKLYAQDMKAECFIDEAQIEKWYGDNDYHTMYVVEILEALEK